MACHAIFLKKVGTPSKGVLGKNRIAKAGFDKTFDGFGVVRFHDDARCDADFFKVAIDDPTNVTPFGIEKKWHISEFRSAHRTDVAAADLVGGRAHDEELFVKKRNELEVGFSDWQRNESEIETSVEQTGDHFFGYANSDANFGVRVLLAKLAQRTT